ncbi:unnamed protein product (macronuclear) [Paramecium tetraurelia]|uniref:Uncharacterized protein n=1 Tax=Paramecium tetraurelia TaxID=5888 RepID=A0C4E3_PARTE|nr:uncharacterized protein GSPATT00035140001 [Paramecium tetraurelia]CAK65660.1 unnamed protein product [Paramecium tetraurelia]|eukprot:XP_001433057.1 hypothetical protein (macronuclear) [Paramecium tetraurelia strain d4-2]
MTKNLRFQKVNDALPIIQPSKSTKLQQDYQESCSTERVRRLVNKVKAQLKLTNNTHDVRFNRQLQQFKILETFIDTKTKLKRLNIINNRDLLESVKNYLIRRKVARQLDQQEADLEKMYEQYEVEFVTEFDKAFLDSDCFLDLGLVKAPNKKTKELSKERLQDLGRRAVSQFQGCCNQRSNRDYVTKSQYDQNLFYYHVEDQIEQIKKEREETENFLQKLGKSTKCKTQSGEPQSGVQIEQQKPTQIDYDKELYKIVLQYGIDLNSTEQLEEDIYKAFKQHANEFIKSKINEVKIKHSQSIEEDQLKNKSQNKPQKIKISSMFEQQLLNFSKCNPPPKTRHRPENIIHTLPSENRKSQLIQELMEKKKEKTILLSQFNQKSKRIINMCNMDEQKLQYNEFIKDIQLMNLYLDEAITRTNFNRKLSQLGFTKEDQFQIKKQIVLPGGQVRNLRNNQ